MSEDKHHRLTQSESKIKSLANSDKSPTSQPFAERYIRVAGDHRQKERIRLLSVKNDTFTRENHTRDYEVYRNLEVVDE